MPVVGARVLVPLGSRLVTGIVVSIDADARLKPRAPDPGPKARTPDPPLKPRAPDSGPKPRARDPGPTPRAAADIKPIKQLIDGDAFVPAAVVELAQWTAEYYAAGVGDAIPLLLPPMARGARADAHKTRRMASITTGGLGALSSATAKQREVLALLAAAPDGIGAAELGARGFASDLISRLVKRGYISVRQDRIDRDPFADAAGPPTPTGVRAELRQLTGEQASALARLATLSASQQFKVALLHGVTGSGKTELYLRLAALTRESGRRSLMLVPEIALTPATAAQFREAFGDRVAIQHSGLSDGERHDQWQRIRRGDVDIVVGTRSAVFAPLEQVGLIVVDEEHDASYKQEESPRATAATSPSSAPGNQGRWRFGFRHAVDGELSQRDDGKVRTPRARAPRSRSAAGKRHGRRHARGVCRRRPGRHPEPGAS